MPAAADAEPRPFDRWFYRDIAEKYEQKIRRYKARESLGFGGMIGRLAAMMNTDLVDEDYDDDDEFDEPCDCEECRRERGEIV